MDVSGRRGSGLVEILIVTAIVAILVVIVVSRLTARSVTMPASTLGEPGRGTTTRSPMEAARSTACANNLSQIQQALTMRTAETEEPPASLAELNLPSPVTHCPESGAEYLLSGGRPTCPTPGH
jgi:Tfp pilus assembly protein FimT